MVFERATEFPTTEELPPRLPGPAVGLRVLQAHRRGLLPRRRGRARAPVHDLPPLQRLRPRRDARRRAGHRPRRAGPDPQVAHRPRRPLQIFGSGEQTRTLTHVDDIAEGIVTAMSSPAALNEDFNISASAGADRGRDRAHLLGGVRATTPTRSSSSTCPRSRSTCSAAGRRWRRPSACSAGRRRSACARASPRRSPGCAARRPWSADPRDGAATHAVRELFGRGSVYAAGYFVQVAAQVAVLPAVTRLLDRSEYGLVAVGLVVGLAAGGDRRQRAGHGRRAAAGSWARTGRPRRARWCRWSRWRPPASPWSRSCRDRCGRCRSVEVEYGPALRVAVWLSVAGALRAAAQELLRAERRAGRFVAVALVASVGGQVVGLALVAAGLGAAGYLAGLGIGNLVAAAAGGWSARSGCRGWTPLLALVALGGRLRRADRRRPRGERPARRGRPVRARAPERAGRRWAATTSRPRWGRSRSAPPPPSTWPGSRSCSAPGRRSAGRWSPRPAPPSPACSRSRARRSPCSRRSCWRSCCPAATTSRELGATSAVTAFAVMPFMSRQTSIVLLMQRQRTAPLAWATIPAAAISLGLCVVLVAAARAGRRGAGHRGRVLGAGRDPARAGRRGWSSIPSRRASSSALVGAGRRGVAARRARRRPGALAGRRARSSASAWPAGWPRRWLGSSGDRAVPAQPAGRRRRAQRRPAGERARPRGERVAADRRLGRRLAPARPSIRAWSWSTSAAAGAGRGRCRWPGTCARARPRR